MESAGHYVTTFGDHEVLFCGYPPGGVWGNFTVFNGLEGGVCCKVHVLRNLEANLLKTEDLPRCVRRTEPGRDAAAGPCIKK